MIQFAIHILGRAPLGTLEDHMLEEMAHAGNLGGFVAGTGTHKPTDRSRKGRGIV